MDPLTLIKTRRSIRRYTGEVISDDELRELLELGFIAPTAVNRQPVEFVVIRDRDIFKEIVEIQPFTKMLDSAGTGIIICGNLDLEESLGFLVEAGSASIQNILLGAHGMGLGAVWCGIHGRKEYEDGFREILDIPDNIVPIGLVVVGNTEEEARTVDRYDEDKIHFERWEGK